MTAIDKEGLIDFLQKNFAVHEDSSAVDMRIEQLAELLIEHRETVVSKLDGTVHYYGCENCVKLNTHEVVNKRLKRKVV